MFLFRSCMALVAALVLAAPALAEPAIATGRLVDVAGEPAAGVPVGVYLSRDVDTDSDVALPLVASGTTDATGRFAVTTDETPELAAFADANGGYLNLDVVGTSDQGLWYTAIVRRYSAAPEWVAAGGPAPDILLAPSRSAIVDPATDATPSIGCTVVKRLVATERRRTAIGELHNARDVAYSKLTYGRRADSDISVGYSSNGTSWSVNGSVHVGNSEQAAQTTTVTADNWGHRLLTDFSYGKYRYSAPCAHQTWWKIAARAWIPGRHTGRDNSQYDHHCLDTYRAHYSHFGPGDSFYRAWNSYGKFAGAATVGFGTGGLELSAKSGLSQWVDVYWKFGSAAHHYLCGPDDFISASHRIFAGA